MNNDAQMNHSHIDINLNPAYLRSRKIVLLGSKHGIVTVGCAHDLTVEERNALRFATGLTVRSVKLSEDEIATNLAKSEVEQSNDASASRQIYGSENANAPDQRSLAELFWGRLSAPFEPKPTLVPLARLLQAGYSTREAGGVLQHMQNFSVRRSPAMADLSSSLKSESRFDETIRQSAVIPSWMKSAIAAFHTEDDQEAAFTALVLCDRAIEKSSVRMRSQRIDCAILWVISAVIWFFVANWAGAIIAAAALAGTFQFHRLAGVRMINDLTRSYVLRMLATLSCFDMPPSITIRTSMARLNASAPTWGTLPDTREGLANALRLSPIPQAILMKGELADAAQRMADHYSVRAAEQIASYRWWNLRLAGALFASAVLVLAVR